MFAYRKFMPDGPPSDTDVYWIKSHGGLGDVIWLYKHLCNLDKPLFIWISQEHRQRPRRAGALVDHLPRVVGWAFHDRPFCPNGEDWGPPTDPACALGKTWAELNVPLNSPIRLECNRHLESGKRLEDWLPDVPTTHHFALDPAGPPSIQFQKPYVVFHIAGWPDVAEVIWINLIDVFRGLAHVYIVGGSYDHRPRRVYDMVRAGGGVTLLEDVAWPDLVWVLAGCAYCFGHASGFTALADVLRVAGAVVNPAQHPRLVGTWNSPDNPGLVQCATADEFRSVVYAAYRRLADGPQATWPPTLRAGPKLAAAGATADDAVRAAAGAAPRTAAVWVVGAHPPGLGAAVLDGVYAVGRAVDALTLVGCSADVLANVFRESLRSTRRPALDATELWAPATPYDLIVAYPNTPRPADAADLVGTAWRAVAGHGTLLVGGPHARVAVEAVGAALRVRPAEVQNAPGWWYLHRRL